MPAKETRDRLLEGLRGEVRWRYGRIGKLEREAKLPRGRLSELYSGRKGVSLEAFLKALDALEIEHGRFFSQVLGVDPLKLLVALLRNGWSESSEYALQGRNPLASRR